MTNTKNQLLMVLCLLFALKSQAQHSYAQQLRLVNNQIAAAYMRHDTAGLLRIYAKDAVSMPEYHLTLFGKKAISYYLRKWTDSARVDSYSRKTYDITKAGNYLVETGTFSNKFSLREKAVEYEGKYISIWQIKSGGGLQLISEITGATKYMERTGFPLSALQIPDTTRLPRPRSDKTSKAIQTMNNEVARLVIEGKGMNFAKYYATDAIYMPYYMPMKIGKAAIDAYYREHEKPDAGIDAVHIGITRIINAGNFALVDCYYKVDWHGDNAHGSVTGKNISVWKRDRSGHLLLFRQMAVHD